MDEQFDDKLKSRITEVFDNYEFPPADDAWLELRKKFPVEEERKIAWLWWSSAAAILLVFLGLGIWFNSKKDNTTNIAGNTVKGKNRGSKPESVRQAPNGQNNIAVNPVQSPGISKPVDSKGRTINPPLANGPVNYTAVTTLVKKQLPAINNSKTLDNNALNKSVTANHPTVEKPLPVANIKPAVNNGSVNNAVQPVQSQPVVAGVTPNSNQNPTVSNSNEQQIAIIATPNAPADGGSKPGSVETKPAAKTVQDLFKETKPPQVAQQKAEKKELKKVNFSVFAATYLNYAEGSSNQINAGAGFTSDIRLGKRVKLSTGVTLAQNTLSYAGGAPPVNTNSRTFADAIPAITQSGLFNPTASVAELKGSNASLVGLDIPINIKFEFNPDKTDTYISAGLSSGTFIDERYTYRYAYHNNSLGYSSVTTTENQTTSQSFNSFYFGKTLNVSFGTGFPIGKTNRLVIEPFLKYPLGGMGAQNIHFGSGGINLKFNFKATKK